MEPDKPIEITSSAMPTAAENVTTALQRLAHKKMVLLILTTIYLAKVGAHPAYLLINGLIGTGMILIADWITAKESNTKSLIRLRNVSAEPKKE